MEVNKKIQNCLYDLNLKVDDATNKAIGLNKVSNVVEVSWKLIDCLIEDEVKTIQNNESTYEHYNMNIYLNHTVPI